MQQTRTTRRTRAAIVALAAVIAVAGAGGLLAHSGKLDSDGCHFSEAEGYHCH